MTADNQRRARNAWQPSVDLRRMALEKHELIITHGNGPQVGLLALQAEAAYDPERCLSTGRSRRADRRHDRLSSIEQEMRNALLPFGGAAVATLLTTVEVDADDPAFRGADQVHRPGLFAGGRGEASLARHAKNWSAASRDGDTLAPGAVPSPLPQAYRRAAAAASAPAGGRTCVVICAGGGGIPTIYDENRKLHGVEAVIDKDFASELLARDLEADLFIMATDAEAVFVDWGTPQQKGIRRASPEAMKDFDFPAGSMGPKVDAACQFAELTGKAAAIGALADLPQIVAGTAGTTVTKEAAELVWH